MQIFPSGLCCSATATKPICLPAVQIGHETSLRYAIHLITAASLISQKRKAQEVDIEDLSKAYSMFVDVKRSTQYLIDFASDYMFNEVDEMQTE